MGGTFSPVLSSEELEQLFLLTAEGEEMQHFHGRTEGEGRRADGAREKNTNLIKSRLLCGEGRAPTRKKCMYVYMYWGEAASPALPLPRSLLHPSAAPYLLFWLQGDFLKGWKMGEERP